MDDAGEFYSLRERWQSFPRSLFKASFRGGSGALIVGIEDAGPNALGVARSLGRRGIPVWVLARTLSVASVSRYYQRTIRWPEATDAEQIQVLLDLADQCQLDGWALFAVSDKVAALLAQHYERLAKRYRLTVPPWEIVRWAYDKRFTYQLAGSLGIDHPWTCYPDDRSAVRNAPCRFPVILKPAYQEPTSRFACDKAWRADNRDDLIGQYDEVCKSIEPSAIMLQAMIPGGGECQFSYAALCDNGRTLAAVTVRRTRQYPIDFGRSSTYVETVSEPGVEEPAQRLLAAVNYSGVAELEFKRDPRDGRYNLLDFNARFWVWHSLCRRAGVDFPYLLWCLRNGQDVPLLRGTTGARWLRLATDIFAAWHGIAAGRLSLPAYLRSVAVARDWAVFALDDPLPALVDTFVLLRKGLAR